MNLNFSDAALVLVGHGSTVNAESSKPVSQHAKELRQRGLFAEVHEAFWKQEPKVDAVIEAIVAPRIFIVPIFISEGYFSERVIPQALGFRTEPAEECFARVKADAARRVAYCRPVGTHPSMTRVLLARAQKVVADFPAPECPAPKDLTMIIAGHGTGEDENSRKAIDTQVEIIRKMGFYAAVHSAFMEEEPRIQDCHKLVQTRNMVVVPFFISDGLHVTEDIPVLLGDSESLVRQRLNAGQPTWRNPTEKKGKVIWYAPGVGSEPLLVEVILERVQEASAWMTLSNLGRAESSDSAEKPI